MGYGSPMGPIAGLSAAGEPLEVDVYRAKPWEILRRLPSPYSAAQPTPSAETQLVQPARYEGGTPAAAFTRGMTRPRRFAHPMIGRPSWPVFLAPTVPPIPDEARPISEPPVLQDGLTPPETPIEPPFPYLPPPAASIEPPFPYLPPPAPPPLPPMALPPMILPPADELGQGNYSPTPSSPPSRPYSEPWHLTLASAGTSSSPNGRSTKPWGI